MSRVGTFIVVRGAVVLALIAFGAPFAHAPALASPVAWPASSSLLVGEVVTRGSAASDQYVELFNASPTAVDLVGVELVYVTASGLTVTRKQTWSVGSLLSGAHLLLANSAGAFAAEADGVFNGGFSTSGGTLALRQISGQMIDSLSWGSANSSFVEGLSGGAPPTGSSLERRPGGAAGNWLDTNDNSADAFINAAPVAQGLAAPLVPPPTAMPSPSETTSPTITPAVPPSPTDSPPPSCPTPPASPTEIPTPPPTDSPTASPPPTPSPSPTTTPTPPSPPTPLASPSPTRFATPTPAPSPPPTPSAAPTVVPTAEPSPVSTPETITIGTARRAPLRSTVSVVGRLTTPLGLIDNGRGAFIESGGAGIAVRLVAGAWPPIAPGTDVRVTGALDNHDGQLTIDLPGPSDVAIVGSGPMPLPYVVATGLVCEPFEGRLLALEGLIGSDATQEPDGLRRTIDDGSGSLIVVAPLGSLVQASDLPAGTRLNLVGVIGQRDVTGSGISGYRLILRSLDDVRSVGVLPGSSVLNSREIVTLALAAAVLAMFAARVRPLIWRRRGG